MTARCTFCNRLIEAPAGRWVHTRTGSIYCDLSGTTKAAPR
jgi:hypothetical protein